MYPSGTDFETGLASPADAESIAGVVGRSTSDAYAGLLSAECMAGLSRSRLANSYLRGIERGDKYWRARHNGQVVGMARATVPRDIDPPTPLELTMIYVDNEFRGSGIAQVLLDSAVADLPCLLWVGAENYRAQAFYRRNGFSPDGQGQRVPVLENILGIRMVR